MAKRYHDSGNMGVRSKSMDRGTYADLAGKRTQEAEDGGMIREDRSAIANLPQEVMIKPYRMSDSYMPESLDDTIDGVDRQMGMDRSKRNEHLSPHKF